MKGRTRSYFTRFFSHVLFLFWCHTAFWEGGEKGKGVVFWAWKREEKKNWSSLRPVTWQRPK
jgi:hypothetical protein